MAKMNAEEKKAMLLDGFEVFKKNPEKNDGKIANTIQKMLKIGEAETAFEMLRWVILNNPFANSPLYFITEYYDLRIQQA